MAGNGTYAAAYAIARSLVGYKPPGPNTDDNKISRWYGVITSWCAETMSYVLAAAGVPGAFRATRVTLFAQHYAALGRAGRTPRVGALACYDWTGDGLYDHIGLVIGVDPDGQHITTIEGNTTPGGPIGVYVMRRAISLVKLFCYPQYTPALPPPVAPAAVPVVHAHWKPAPDLLAVGPTVPANTWQKLHPGEVWRFQDGRAAMHLPAEDLGWLTPSDGGHNGKGQVVALAADLMRAYQYRVNNGVVTLPRATEMTPELWSWLMNFKASHNITAYTSGEHTGTWGPWSWGAATGQTLA